MLASLLFLVSTATAEVGVSLSNDATSFAYYEMQSIIDDPEPVGIVWAQYNTSSPNRVILNPEGEASGDGPPSSLVTEAGIPAVAWWIYEDVHTNKSSNTYSMSTDNVGDRH